ncbi:hypothetical protein I4U23_021367 [Adineta vaga]|nr:hypothetical protein I4U23_021367 [Adineta vaga]
MNIYNLNELSTTSESDSEYLVDSRYCRTTVKCKRKALKKTIKLIHGRCVVIYRGSGDLLPIAAKDADRNCYCDFVFVCHDPRPMKSVKETSVIAKSRSAIHESSTSDSDNNEMINNNNALMKSYMNQQLLKQDSFSFKTKLNDDHKNESINDLVSLKKKNSIQCQKNEEVDVDVDELAQSDEPFPSIIYFPSSHTKLVSKNIDETS